jgi:hypothetical protein
MNGFLPSPSRTAAVALALAAAACASSPPPADSCALLFGRPVAATGLSADQCRPQCACGGTSFAPPTYDEAFAARLVSDWSLENPSAPLTSDPYASPLPAAPEDGPDTVCAVLPTGAAGSSPRAYRLETYASETAARAAGATPTHFGRCGVCSSLENLAVYLRVNDLTAPVRDCGIANLDLDGDVTCLRGLGFDEPCAQIWAYNTLNTRGKCLLKCSSLLKAPYHLPDGSLNECLRCDEENSGAVFKAVAGRTRRNSGIPSALCRPCSETRPLVHAY